MTKKIKQLIYPTPKNLEVKDNKFIKPEVFNIYIEEFNKTDIVNSFDNYFLDFSISFTDNIEEANTIIKKEIKGSHFNKEGSYVLELKDNKVLINTNTISGLNYSVLTLSQLFKTNSLNELLIKDYPDILSRGYIEGFYGYPWTHKERLDLIKVSSFAKMNNYIYAPKDDLYHRLHWRDLYPKKELNRIKELNDFAKKRGVIFTWTLHPGASINLASEEDYQSTLKKLNQLKDIGVMRFGILFDDIFKNEDANLQADFINKIDRDFIKPNNLLPLIMVGTRYCSAWGPSFEDYTKVLFLKLNPDIEIMWTGAGVMSNVSDEVFQDPIKQTGVNRELSIWWNYPVNDYCDQKLFIDKITSLKNDLTNIKGFYSNPAHEAYATMISLIQIGNYTWNIKEYDPDFSYEKSLDIMGVEHKEAFKRFANNITSNEITDITLGGPMILDESSYLKEKIEKFTKKLNDNKLEEGDIKDLLNEFLLIKEDYEKLLTLSNKNLLKDIKAHLAAYGHLGNAGISLLNYLLTKDSKLKAKGQKDLAKMNNCIVVKLKPKDKDNPTSGINKKVKFVVAVGTKLLKPLLKEILNK